MFVQSILNAKGAAVATIGSTATIRASVELLKERGVGALVVSDDGRRIDGILSERDVVRCLANHPDDALDLLVGDVMTTAVTTCGMKDTIDQLMWLMTDQRIRHLPVADDDGLLAGIVSIGDVVKNRLGQLESENQALFEYITQGR